MSDRVTGYAQALLEVATAEGALDRVVDEMNEVRRALRGDDELRSTLVDQAIPVERRQGVVERLIGDRAHPVTTNLVQMVVGAGRAGDLDGIVDSLQEMAAAKRGRQVAEVRSALPISDEQRDRLAAALAQRLGNEVDVRVTVDPTLVGGIVTQVGDTVLDGSVRTRLSRLKDRL